MQHCHYIGESYESLKYVYRIAAQTIGKIIPETCAAIVDVLQSHLKVNVKYKCACSKSSISSAAAKCMHAYVYMIMIQGVMMTKMTYKRKSFDDQVKQAQYKVVLVPYLDCS